MVNIDTLLRLMFERGASDLHITAGAPPMLRVDGVITPTNTKSFALTRLNN